MKQRTIVRSLLSNKVNRASSIVDDPQYQQERRRPLLPRFVTATGDHRCASDEYPDYAYNPVAAYLASVASAWAYSDAETLRAEVKDVLEVDVACHEFSAANFTLYLDTDAFFIRTNDPELKRSFGMLVFRGTELTQLGDLLADAYVQLLPFPGSGNEKGKVHGGFYQGAKAVWKRVYWMLMQPENQVDDLIITGHSLGAAMAVLMMAQIHSEQELQTDPRFKKVVKSLRGLYTFGQPAVGDANFARWAQSTFGGMTFRHVFARDIVPLLPTTDINALYQHFKSGVWTAERESSTWSGPNSDRSFNVAKSLGVALVLALTDFYTRRVPFRHWTLRRFFDYAIRYSVDDHSPLNYIRVSEASYHGATQALEPFPWNPPPGGGDGGRNRGLPSGSRGDVESVIMAKGQVAL
jgi:hypothetical protein